MDSSSSASPPANCGITAAPASHVAAALAVLAAVAAATVINAWLDKHVSVTVLAMVYLVSVVSVAYHGSLQASAAAACLAVLSLNFFFVPPRGTLSVDGSEYLLTMAAMLGVALLVSSLAARLRTAALQAELRERRAQALQRLASRLAALDEEPAIAGSCLAELRAAYGETAVLALCHPGGPIVSVGSDRPLAEAGDELYDALQHCAAQRYALGYGTSRWADLRFRAMPLEAADQCVGALAIETVNSHASELEHLRAMADLIAGAVLRVRHASAAAAAHRDADLQRMRNALLASVSHDFRTPLASILGAVSSLKQQDERLTPEARADRLSLVEDETHHLIVVTENTLQWARLMADVPVLHTDWESLEEIVGAALARVRRRDPSRRVRADIPDQLPLVMVDAVLMAQLLDNLVDNALKYTVGPVLIRARASSQRTLVEVLDRGEGFDEAELPRLFDTFVRGARVQGTRGAGLGMAVARAIAQAHGGSLAASRRPGGGSRVRLSLPLQTPPCEEAAT